jgi:hypothetical protein
MPESSTTAQTVRVKKSARPWSGFFLGLILGLAVAIMLQQAGVWPADRLLVFGSAGAFALIGVLMAGAGRDRVGPVASLLPLILAVGMIAFGATGFAAADDTGNINGGCQVIARSSVDETNVVNTSARDPFDIDPDGSLEWVATSAEPIQDYDWALFVEFAGFDIELDSGSETNEGGAELSAGSTDDLSEYVEAVTGISGQPLLGTFIVSGVVEVDSATVCDGFAFVRLTADSPLASMAAKIAAAIAIIALICLLFLAFNRYRDAELAPETPDGTPPSGDGTMETADTVGAAAAAGAVAATEDSEGGDGTAATDVAEPPPGSDGPDTHVAGEATRPAEDAGAGQPVEDAVSGEQSVDDTPDTAGEEERQPGGDNPV